MKFGGWLDDWATGLVEGWLVGVAISREIRDGSRMADSFLGAGRLLPFNRILMAPFTQPLLSLPSRNWCFRACGPFHGPMEPRMLVSSS